MATTAPSPALDPTPGSSRGSGRGGRAGRGGRGGGRGGRAGGRGTSSTSGQPKTAAASNSSRSGNRRGRVKTFGDSRVQAAYDRQRDLKAIYQAVAHAVKPALQELTQRSLDHINSSATSYQQPDAFSTVFSQLRQRLESVVAVHGRRAQHDRQLADHFLRSQVHTVDTQFMNTMNDLCNQFYDGLYNRLRILNSLHAKRLPVDVRDDQYEYKVITDDHLDNDFGPYEEYVDGRYVPYPGRIEGSRLWNWMRAKEAERAAEMAAAVDAGTMTAKGRGGRGRGAAKRKAQTQPENQPAPKKSTRGTTRLARLASASELLDPAPVKGLLTAEAAGPSDRNASQVKESIPASSDAPTSRVEGTGSGDAKTSSTHDENGSNTDSDEHGGSAKSQNPKQEVNNNGIALSPLVKDEELEAGSSDSTNDNSQKENPSKDSSPDFYVMPGKPVVFIANPSGRLSHASRSFQKTMNERYAEQAPIRARMRMLFRQMCKTSDVDVDGLSVAKFSHSDDDLRAKSLGTAERELSARPQTDDEPSSPVAEPMPAPEDEPTGQTEGGMPALSVLTYAAALEEAKQTIRVALSTAQTSRYDAIRDVFTKSKPDTPSTADTDALALNVFAHVCNVEPRLPESSISASGTAPALVLARNSGTSISDDQGFMPTTYLHRNSPGQGSARRSFDSSAHQNSRESAFLRPYVPAHAPRTNPDHYAGHQETSLPPQRHAKPADSQPHPSALAAPCLARPPPPPPPPPQVAHPGGLQDQQIYHRSSSYALSDHRHGLLASSSRQVEAGFGAQARGFGGLGYESAMATPIYGARHYWSQHPHPGPAPIGVNVPSSQHHYRPPPTTTHSTQNANSEPLPPLRPPRSRNQSYPEEPMHGGHSSFYTAAPPRAYPRAFSEPHLASQPPGSERMMQQYAQQPQSQQAYMGSPPALTTYPPQVTQHSSPVFGNTQAMSSQIMQRSPPGTPLAAAGPSHHHHRATPSASTEAGNVKYRKLQPAPMPPDQASENTPELRTIFYDPKETGSSAELPNSGPTQIRGWNVNQHRKRSRQERTDPANEREDSR